jgi:excisionase family DNA binding protein
MEKTTVRDRLLRVDEVAAKLNINKRTAYRLIALGCFEGCKVGGSIRIFEGSVDRYIQHQAAIFSSEVGFCVNHPNE